MSKRYNKKKERYKKIADQRIHRLFHLAEQYALQDRLALANRYVFLARKISMKYLVPIPHQWKRRFCKRCYAYLLPGVSCRTRIHNGRVITYCSNCKNYMRLPLQNRHVKKSLVENK